MVDSKLKFPKKLVVGGMTYKVKYPYAFVDSSEYLGLHSGIGGWIRVGNHKGRAPGPRDNQAVITVFLHEMLHAVDAVYGGEVLTEEEIDIFTRAIYQVLADNDLMLTVSEMPTNVRICGADFAVINEYDYEDMPDATSHVDFDTYEMFIGKELNGIKFCEQFKKITFMYTLAHSILYMYMDNKGVRELTDKISIRSFSHGLYQVLRDNKIEELFKEWTKRQE